MYAYSDMEYNRQFFVILGHFLLFYKKRKKHKKHLEILPFYTYAP